MKNLMELLADKEAETLKQELIVKMLHKVQQAIEVSMVRRFQDERKKLVTQHMESVLPQIIEAINSLNMAELIQKYAVEVFEDTTKSVKQEIVERLHAKLAEF